MHRQKSWPLDGQEALDALWERFPESNRREVVSLYARLMAVAVREEREKEKRCDEFEV